MPSVAQHLAKQETAKLVDAVDKKCFVPLACTMWIQGAARSPSLTVNVVVEP